MSNLKHGLSRTPEYRVWQTMRLRCTEPNNPAWADYGGRGITVCERWLNSPQAFVDDMGPKPSPKHEIDRIDNDAGYSPDNCRWATRSENDRNRRSTAWIEFRGERRRLIDLCEEFGVPADTVRFRLRKEWTVEATFTTPVRDRAPNGQGKKHLPRPPRRQKFQRGEANHAAKLTDDQRRAVHLAYRSGDVSQAALGRAFGVSQTVIGNIVRDPRWSS